MGKYGRFDFFIVSIKEEIMSRFETDQPYRPKDNMDVIRDKSVMIKDVRDNLREDYNYAFGKEYKELLLRRNKLAKELCRVNDEVAGMKYEPPVY
jgi:hypothetical protein